MERILAETLEIPERGKSFLSGSPNYHLPLHVPYIGMGSSYFAPLAFKYMGISISPELASEYFPCLSKNKQTDLGVILSQSGRSSEALWCTLLFQKYIAITNDTDSKLANHGRVKKVIPLMAGDEHHSSSKTYINTLLALFKGFGMDASEAFKLLCAQMEHYETRGREMAGQVFDLLQTGNIHGIYITGSGPNIATALEAALIMSESTKRNFHGLPMAQYDHGPKETARNSIVIQILAKSAAYKRSLGLSEKIKAAGAHVIHVEEPDAEEKFSVLHNIVPFNFMAYYLAAKLGIGETFTVGGKVTEV